MAFGVLKESVHQLEEFISNLLNVQQESLNKINGGKYKSIDLFDYECLNYNIAGIFFMVNLFRFDYKIEMQGKSQKILLKSREKEISYSQLVSFTEVALQHMKKIQIEEISKNIQDVFDNPCLNENVEFLFLYFYYGMKVVCSFFDINLNGKENEDKVLTLGQSTLIQKELAEFRRSIAKLSLYAKNRIEAYDKIKITNLRIQVLEIRKQRFDLERGFVDSKSSNKSMFSGESNYCTSRINFHNTELIKFRSDLTTNEELLNEELKLFYKEYLGIE